MFNYKKVHISGIGGIAISAIAKFLHARGVQVSGSDLVKSQVTEELEKLGLKIKYEQTAENLDSSVELFIYSPAVPETNPERVKAADLKIPQKSYPEMIGELSKSYKTIAISGTKGKSTTTSKIADILMRASLDPTVIVGSKYSKLNGNFRDGKGEHFVVEGCEYRGAMLNLSPKAIVLTNIEADHLDYFRDINHIIETFQEYIDKLTQADDILIINNDDINSNQLRLPNCHIITYGISEAADLKASNIKNENYKQKFQVNYRGSDLGEFELQIPGRINVYNALAAMALALSLDIKIDVIRESLREFPGLWRRFEKVIDDKIVVVSDYAHHPTAVKGTIRGAKEFYPDKKIISVFQPHQHNRTKNLFNDFIESFEESEVVILPEIFGVAGREEAADQAISSLDLVKEIKDRWPEKKVLYAKDLTQTLELVNFNVKLGDLVLIMGAGDIYLIADKVKVSD